MKLKFNFWENEGHYLLRDECTRIVKNYNEYADFSIEETLQRITNVLRRKVSSFYSVHVYGSHIAIEHNKNRVAVIGYII